MKKILVFAFAVALALPAFSQESAVQSAWEYLQTYDRERAAGNESASIQSLLDAKKEIDNAAVHPNSSQKSKTWKYRGDVYYQIATNPSPQLILQKNGALDTATASFLKALVVEKKENGKPVIHDKNDIIYTKLASIGNKYMDDGGKAADAKDFKKSVAMWLKARQIYDEIAKNIEKNEQFLNASKGALYNISIMYSNMNDADNAIKSSEELLSLGYDSVGVYQNLLYLYMQKGDNTKTAEVLSKAKQKYPNNADLFMTDLMLALENKDDARARQLIEEGKTRFPDRKTDIILQEVNFHLTKNDNEKALQALEEAIGIYSASTKPDDKNILTILYFNAGLIYDNLAEKMLETNKDQSGQYMTKALEYYNKTLELDPNYVAAYNQLANYHVRMGNDYITTANNLPLDKSKEFNEMKGKADSEYKTATELLEKGYAIKQDETIKKNLIELYKKTQQLDKLKALQGE